MGKNQLRPALAAFLLMLTMSLLSTALSFFVSPVCADLGFGRGSFTLYYSLMGRRVPSVRRFWATT